MGRPRHAHGEPARAILQEGFKLIEHIGRLELYQTREDLREERDLSLAEPELTSRLAEFLPRLSTEKALLSTEKALPSNAEPLSHETLSELRALGYVD